MECNQVNFRLQVNWFPLFFPCPGVGPRPHEREVLHVGSLSRRSAWRRHHHHPGPTPIILCPHQCHKGVLGQFVQGGLRGKNLVHWHWFVKPKCPWRCIGENLSQNSNIFMQNNTKTKPVCNIVLGYSLSKEGGNVFFLCYFWFFDFIKKYFVSFVPEVGDDFDEKSPAFWASGNAKIMFWDCSIFDPQMLKIKILCLFVFVCFCWESIWIMPINLNPFKAWKFPKRLQAYTFMHF